MRVNLPVTAVEYELAPDAALVSLTGCYHNLLRRWGDA